MPVKICVKDDFVTLSPNPPPQISSQLNNDVSSLKITAASWEEILGIWRDYRVIKLNQVRLKTEGPLFFSEFLQ